ncbi:thiazole/oxazole-forming peptide maturase SagD family component [Arthrobacter sp. PL16]|uniref:YcaO-like family protein n=1 Tax=Arthrobacter sp. PL16 TaxID=3071720 RepID=UPI002DFBF879|nr:thiazole/oxazole-forming peptide maturase SagD family component [Arthrobacter sp. PL16]
MVDRSRTSQPAEGALTAAAEAYEVALPGLRAQFAIDGLDRTGVPTWATWWRGSGAALGGVGYGPSAAQARVGALGETVENAFSLMALARFERTTASYRELRRRRGAAGVADPRTLGLPAGSSYHDDMVLTWLPMRRARVTQGAGSSDPRGVPNLELDGEAVLVPVDLVASSPSELDGQDTGERLLMPVANGMGAGTSLRQAVVHGVLEILQRDGNGLTFRALDRGAVVKLGPDDGDAETRQALEALRAAGVDVMVKIASTDRGVPNLYVVGHAPGDDLVIATACGEAAHPDRDVALRKAVLEFASARARKAFMHGPLAAVRSVAPRDYLDDALAVVDPAAEEPRVLEATVGWLTSGPEQEAAVRARLDATVFSRRSTVRFGDLPTSPTADPAVIMAEHGLEVLVADLTPPESTGDGAARAVKVVVPGTEVETVAYARIGEAGVRRLLDDGRDDLSRVGRRPEGDGWREVILTPEAVERLGGPAWLDRDAVDALATGLLPLYREPGRHAARLVLGEHQYQ